MNKQLITALEPQKKHPDRRSVYADGTFLFGLNEEVCIKMGLRQGMEYTPEELEQIRREGELFDAKSYSFRLLARRSYSVAGIVKKLEDRDYLPETVEQTVALLCRLGYLNDAEYARAYAHDAVVLRKKGKRLVIHELLTRGIDRETAEQAWEAVCEQNDQGDALAQIIAKRLKDPSDKKAVRRVFDYCIRRGYDYAAVSDALRQYIEEEMNEESGTDFFGLS